MVHISSMMVAVTAMVLGINALDDNSANRLRDELKAANIIPDAFENVNPLTEMKIIYNDKEVKNGDKILPSEAANRPGIQFTAPDKNKQYTIVMEDLDTPAPHVRHWIATNIKGADAESVVNDPSKMQDYVPYKGPTPPNNGFHRYVFALYEQSQENQKMVPELEDPTNHRAFFDVNKFAEENKLNLVAASYMNSEHQEGFDSTYSKADKRSLARRAVSKKKGYTPDNRLARRDIFDDFVSGGGYVHSTNGQNGGYSQPSNGGIVSGDGYTPNINGQYGGTWSDGQSFSSGYGQPSNGGRGGYDSGAGAIVAGNGPPGSIPGNYDPTTNNWYYTNTNPSSSSGNVFYNGVNPGGNNPTGNGYYYINGGNPGGNTPPGNGYYYGNGGNTGGNIPNGNGYYYGNGGRPGGNFPPGSGTGGINGDWYFNGNSGSSGTSNGGGIIIGGSGRPNGNGGIVIGGGGSGTKPVGTGNGGIVIGGGAVVDPKPTPIATPVPTPNEQPAYYTYFYTIDGVDYQPGQTYRGNDGQLYRIPFPSATPGPNLHRRDEFEEEKPIEKKEEVSMKVVEFSEGSGLDEDDIKLYNGIQDAIRAMDEAADDLNDLVAEVYLGDEEEPSAN